MKSKGSALPARIKPQSRAQRRTCLSRLTPGVPRVYEKKKLYAHPVGSPSSSQLKRPHASYIPCHVEDPTCASNSVATTRKHQTFLPASLRRARDSGPTCALPLAVRPSTSQLLHAQIHNPVMIHKTFNLEMDPASFCTMEDVSFFVVPRLRASSL